MSGQSQALGKNLGDCRLSRVRVPSSSSLKLDCNHHDKRYAKANTPQNSAFQFSNSVQVASQNTLISSTDENDRQKTTDISRSSHSSPMMHITFSDFEELRTIISNRFFVEGYQKGREVGYAEAVRALQERSRTQRTSMSFEHPPCNIQDVRRRQSMAIESLAPTIQNHDMSMNTDPSGPSTNALSAPAWTSPAHEQLLASIFVPHSQMSDSTNAAANSFPTDTQTSQTFDPRYSRQF